MQIINKYSFALISSALVWNLAYAAPTSGTVVAGGAVINQAGTVTTINQSSSSAVINWQGFDTAANESVVFNQPSASSTVLNRINSGLPTTFAGSLSANGQVFIVNPSGMVFAQGSKINAAGFFATTSDITDHDFMQNKYQFSAPNHKASDTASIINYGNITTADSGVVALIAPNVINNGVIQANLNKVVLASGRTFVLDFNQDGLINFDVGSTVQNGHVVNSGAINADGGKVIMTANTVSEILDRTSSNYTINEAGNIVVGKNGVVILDAGNSGSVNVSGYIKSGSTALIAKNGFVSQPKILRIIPKDNSAVNAIVLTGIETDKLLTASAMGTRLDSDNNHISLYSATNTQSGDISLTNSADLTIHGITQTGGNLIINNIGEIYQPGIPQAAMKISGTSSFTQAQSHLDGFGIRLFSDNQFTGPVSFSNADLVLVNDSEHNIILGNVSTSDLYIQSAAGTITQAPNTALTVTGSSFFETGDAEITLTNKTNKLSGEVTLNNSHFGNKNISLYNSANTSLHYVNAGGVLTVVSEGLITATDANIYSNATNAVNNHSIIFSAPKVEVDAVRLHSGENNSYVIFTQNPDAMSFDSSLSSWLEIHLGVEDKPVEPKILWNQAYSVDAVKNILAGNYVVYSDKSPVMAAAEIKPVGK